MEQAVSPAPRICVLRCQIVAGKKEAGREDACAPMIVLKAVYASESVTGRL
jgi:hypothetical protein